MKLLKKVRNKVSYIVKMRRQKGIGGFLRKNWESRSKTEAYNIVSNLSQKKKKSKKNVEIGTKMAEIVQILVFFLFHSA